MRCGLSPTLAGRVGTGSHWCSAPAAGALGWAPHSGTGPPTVGILGLIGVLCLYLVQNGNTRRPLKWSFLSPPAQGLGDRAQGAWGFCSRKLPWERGAGEGVGQLLPETSSPTPVRVPPSGSRRIPSFPEDVRASGFPGRPGGRPGGQEQPGFPECRVPGSYFSNGLALKYWYYYFRRCHSHRRHFPLQERGRGAPPVSRWQTCYTEAPRFGFSARSCSDV